MTIFLLTECEKHHKLMMHRLVKYKEKGQYGQYIVASIPVCELCGLPSDLEYWEG